MGLIRSILFNPEFRKKATTKFHFLSLLFVVAFIYTLLTFKSLYKTQNVEEHALQINQGSSGFHAIHVDGIDHKIAEIESLAPEQHAHYVIKGLKDLGISVYDVSTSNDTIIVARIDSARSAGEEAVLIVLPLQSEYRDSIGANQAFILQFLKYFTNESKWWNSKDLIVLISSSEKGVESFLENYHGVNYYLPFQPRIIAALHLNISSRGFDTAEAGLDGIYGMLPNLDYVAMFRYLVTTHIFILRLKYNEHIYRMLEWLEDNNPWGLDFLQHIDIMSFFLNQIMGFGSGLGWIRSCPEYRITALSLNLVEGPIEERHSLLKKEMEDNANANFMYLGSLLERYIRSMSTLSEDFHASLFIYFLPTQHTFISPLIFNFLLYTSAGAIVVFIHHIYFNYKMEERAKAALLVGSIYATIGSLSLAHIELTVTIFAFIPIQFIFFRMNLRKMPKYTMFYFSYGMAMVMIAVMSFYVSMASGITAAVYTMLLMYASVPVILVDNWMVKVLALAVVIALSPASFAIAISKFVYDDLTTLFKVILEQIAEHGRLTSFLCPYTLFIYAPNLVVLILLFFTD